MRLSITISALMVCATAVHAEPPPITWEWFNTAEIYRHYKVKGKDDLRIAAHYFLLAASNGNSAAAYKLGEIYENGLGVPKDLAKAFHWYSKAADQGDQYAEFRLGWFYQKGIAVAADAATAADWYKRSAKHDNIWAYHMLAFMLADGEGMPKDTALAKRYFEISLPQTKDSWAKWKLAQLLEPSDPARSMILLREAAAAGNGQAAQDLQRLSARITPNPRSAAGPGLAAR